MQERLQSNPEQAQKLKQAWKQKMQNPKRAKKFQEKLTALAQTDPERAQKIQQLTTLWKQSQDNPEQARKLKEQLAELKKGAWKKLGRKGMT